jgi:hypothetical protein
MAQTHVQYCPRCGTEIIPHQKFCATCGLPAEAQGSAQAAPPVAQMPSGAPGLPPQAYPDPMAQAAQTQIPLEQVQTQQFQYGSAVAPEPPSAKRRLGRNGIILLSIALLLVICAGGYAVLQGLGVGKPAQSAIVKTNIQTSVPYAGVDVTVLNVQQAQNFLDDPATATDGMVRLQIQAQNKAQQSTTLVYNRIAHIVLPGGKQVAVTYTSINPTLVAGAAQTSNVDFAVPTNVKVDQLIFQLGTADEAQLDIPLNGHADVSKYAPKTIQVAKTLSYLSMNWTVTSASSQLSLNGQQASKGMRYVVVAFSVDNPLMQTVISGSPYDYMRINADNTAIAPLGTSLPTSFEGGAIGKTGDATFLVPQDAKTLTLTLSTQNSAGFDPASVALQF